MNQKSDSEFLVLQLFIIVDLQAILKLINLENIDFLSCETILVNTQDP